MSRCRAADWVWLRSGPWRPSSALVVLVLLALLRPAGTTAHEDEFDAGWTPEERRAGYDLVLSMAQVRELATINQRLTELGERNATACAWMNQRTGPESLARQVRAFDLYPGVRDVIAAVMAVKVYLLTLHAVSEAAIAVHTGDPGVPATAAPHNVAFYRAHRGEIERLLDAPDPC